MKKLAFLVLLIWGVVGLQIIFAPGVMARRIVLDIPEEEIAIVETYVIDAEQWIRDAWAGKVNSRREALVKEEVQDSLENGRAIPATKEAIIQQGMQRMGTRKQRDTEENKKHRNE